MTLNAKTKDVETLMEYNTRLLRKYDDHITKQVLESLSGQFADFPQLQLGILEDLTRDDIQNLRLGNVLQIP